MTALEREWDNACADVDDVAEWAVSHPLINTRAEVPLIACSSAASDAPVGREPIFLGGTP